MQTNTQGRIQELKKGGFFERVRARSAPKNLGDHAHFCQTTPILIKTRAELKEKLHCMQVELNCTEKIIQ